MAKGTRIPLVSSLQNVRSQQTFVVLNTEHSEAQEEHTDGGISGPFNTPTSLQPDTAIEDGYPEPSHDTPVFHATNKFAEPKEILETLDAKFNSLRVKKSPSDANAKLELPFNPDKDQMDNEGYTPLYKAALGGHLEDVGNLILRGANPNKPSKGGLSPLHAAAQEGHAHIVDFLILQGADVNVECDLGQTPLHIAASGGYTGIIDSLIAEGAKVNKRDNTGRTPFNDAVQYGHLEAVKNLLTEEANKNRYNGRTPLYAATRFGHLDIVGFLISKGADVDEEGEKGKIPLHGAAARGHLKVMEYLIQKGSDVNKADAKGWTPFNAAVQNGHLEAVKYLITEGAKQSSYNGRTPLYVATRLGYVSIMEFLISKGADVNEGDETGKIPLHGAAARGHLKCMEYLIQKGSDVNKADAKGWTPFNSAVQHGHLEAVKYLITEGANQNRYDGMTPLYAAAQFGHLDIVEFFISKGADVNEEDDNVMIPLHGAAARGHLKVMEYLIQQGSDVNKKDDRGLTLLNDAIRNGHLKVVKLLTAKGAQATRFDGLTPLHISIQYGHIDVVKFLVSIGYDVNERSEYGKCPLHAACYIGNIDIVKYFLLHNANVNAQDQDGCTPLHAALQEGHLDVVNYLALHGADMNVRAKDDLAPLQATENADSSSVLEYVSLCCLQGDGLNLTTTESLVLEMRDADTQSVTGKLAYYVDKAEIGNDCTQSDIGKGGADKLSSKHLPTRTHDVEKDVGRTNVNEHVSPRGAHPDQEDTGDPQSGGHHYGAKHLATRGYAKKKKLIKRKEAHTQSSTGQLASHQVYRVDDGKSCNQADITKRGADELSLKNFPTMIHGGEKGGNGEHNPFIHAKPKYLDKGKPNPMLDQIEAMKTPLTMKGTDSCPPHGYQTWQYSGFDPPYLQTTEADGHPFEEPESRCHSLIDDNREIRESPSPMNAGNDLPMNVTSVKFKSSSTYPPAVAHQKLYAGNPVSTHETSSNPVWKIRTKRRASVDRCPSIIAFLQTFLQMNIVLAIILAGSPVLVAGRDITERVTLQAGKPGVVPFHLPPSPSDTSQGVPFYTLQFKSKPRPFSNNGKADIEGFKSPSQLPRFTTSVTDLDTSQCVNLVIDNVDTLDEGVYVLTAVWQRVENVRYETMMKEIVVQIPPGPAKCFITLSENDDSPYEVHCQATIGSVTSTLSCYQNDQKIDFKGNVTKNGQVIRRIFWLSHTPHFSCCSHYVTSDVNETMCNDFVWPHSKETTSQTVNTVPTSVTTPTPQIESHLESGGCRQFMPPSVWYFTYLFTYLLYVFTMY